MFLSTGKNNCSEHVKEKTFCLLTNLFRAIWRRDGISINKSGQQVPRSFKKLWKKLDSTTAIAYDENECEPRQIAFQLSKNSSFDLNKFTRGNAVLTSLGHRCLSKLTGNYSVI